MRLSRTSPFQSTHEQRAGMPFAARRQHSQCSQHIANQRAAFSLVEVLVVLVIIGLLAGIVTVNVRGYLTRGKQDAAKTQISVFKQALETFYTGQNRYPTNDEGLQVLTQRSAAINESLMDAIPRDPWGNAYQYIQPGRNGPYEVISFGADGREGGDTDTADADISSDITGNADS